MQPMTLWQFYAVFIVMCVVGVGLCYAMLMLAIRCPRPDGNRNSWAHRVRNKLFFALLMIAALCSFGTLDDIVTAFTNDAAGAAAETMVDIGEKAIDGEDINDDLREITTVNLPGKGDVVWGQYDEAQRTSLYLITGFWLFLSWTFYVGFFTRSWATWWQKLCKIIAYPLLTSVMLMFPLNVHYLNSDELTAPLVLLAIAGALILLSHDRTPRPPALPGAKPGNTTIGNLPDLV